MNRQSFSAVSLNRRLLRYLPLLLLFPLVSAGVTWLQATQAEESYASSAVVQVGNALPKSMSQPQTVRANLLSDRFVDEALKEIGEQPTAMLRRTLAARTRVVTTDGSLYEIRTEWPDPNTAAALANALADSFVQQLIPMYAEKRTTLQFVGETLESQMIELTERTERTSASETSDLPLEATSTAQDDMAFSLSYRLLRESAGGDRRQQGLVALIEAYQSNRVALAELVAPTVIRAAGPGASTGPSIRYTLVLNAVLGLLAAVGLGAVFELAPRFQMFLEGAERQ